MSECGLGTTALLGPQEEGTEFVVEAIAEIVREETAAILTGKAGGKRQEHSPESLHLASKDRHILRHRTAVIHLPE